MADKILYVKDAAQRAWNYRQNKQGVTGRFIRAEIERGNLKAELKPVSIGLPYYEITEQDFLAWEERRRGTQGE